MVPRLPQTHLLGYEKIHDQINDPNLAFGRKAVLTQDNLGTLRIWQLGHVVIHVVALTK